MPMVVRGGLSSYYVTVSSRKTTFEREHGDDDATNTYRNVDGFEFRFDKKLIRNRAPPHGPGIDRR